MEVFTQRRAFSFDARGREFTPTWSGSGMRVFSCVCGLFLFSYEWAKVGASDSAPSEGEGVTLGGETDSDYLGGDDDDFDY